VLATARAVSGLPDQELLSPGPRGVTLAELIFGVSHEGAVSADDLLDRRTRLGLVPADRKEGLALANRALEIAEEYIWS
jgi:glycerol-3-phosphate dehydrogenase